MVHYATSRAACHHYVIFCVMYVYVSIFAFVEFKHVQAAWKIELNTSTGLYSGDFMHPESVFSFTVLRFQNL